jgi:hypothetical protein
MLTIIRLFDKKFICKAIKRAFRIQDSACLTQSSYEFNLLKNKEFKMKLFKKPS